MYYIKTALLLVSALLMLSACQPSNDDTTEVDHDPGLTNVYKGNGTDPTAMTVENFSNADWLYENYFGEYGLPEGFKFSVSPMLMRLANGFALSHAQGEDFVGVVQKFDQMLMQKMMSFGAQTLSDIRLAYADNSQGDPEAFFQEQSSQDGDTDNSASMPGDLMPTIEQQDSDEEENNDNSAPMLENYPPMTEEDKNGETAKVYDMDEKIFIPLPETDDLIVRAEAENKAYVELQQQLIEKYDLPYNIEGGVKIIIPEQLMTMKGGGSGCKLLCIDRKEESEEESAEESKEAEFGDYNHNIRSWRKTQPGDFIMAKIHFTGDSEQAKSNWKGIVEDDLKYIAYGKYRHSVIITEIEKNGQPKTLVHAAPEGDNSKNIGNGVRVIEEWDEIEKNYRDLHTFFISSLTEKNKQDVVTHINKLVNMYTEYSFLPWQAKKESEKYQYCSKIIWQAYKEAFPSIPHGKMVTTYYNHFSRTYSTKINKPLDLDINMGQYVFPIDITQFGGSNTEIKGSTHTLYTALDKNLYQTDMYNVSSGGIRPANAQVQNSQTRHSNRFIRNPNYRPPSRKVIINYLLSD